MIKNKPNCTFLQKKNFHDDKNRARNMHFRDQLFNMLRNGFFKKSKIP